MGPLRTSTDLFAGYLFYLPIYKKILLLLSNCTKGHCHFLFIMQIMQIIKKGKLLNLYEMSFIIIVLSNALQERILFLIVSKINIVIVIIIYLSFNMFLVMFNALSL